MNRRAFLTTLATLLAASQLPTALVEALPAPPDIDWQAWNHIEVCASARGLVMRVNGRDVTGYPEIVRQIARFIHIDPAWRFVSFGLHSPAGPLSTISYVLPETMPHDHTLHIGAGVRLHALHGDTAYFNDLYLTSDADVGKATIGVGSLVASCGEGYTRIETD